MINWINPDEYITVPKEEIVGTKGIQSCVGLGIINNNNKSLAHLFYEGTNKVESLETCRRNAKSILDKLSENIKLGESKILPVFMQLDNDESYCKNSMFEFVDTYFRNKGIIIPFKNIDYSQKLNNGKPVFYKTMILDKENLDIQYVDNSEKTINRIITPYNQFKESKKPVTGLEL